MKIIYTVLFVILSLNAWSQNDTAYYYDVNKLLYKKIIASGENVKAFYYDEKGKEINQICNADERSGSLTKHQKDSLFQRISMSLKNNNKQEKRSLAFCFNISKKGVSNIRLIDFKAEKHTSKELQDIIRKALVRSNIKSANDCETNIELNYMEYVQHSIYREKKTP